MKKYNIPFKNSGKGIENIIWKFPFSWSAREMRKKAVDEESIFEIELFPVTEEDLSFDRFPYLPYMLAVKSDKVLLRKDLLRFEKIFPNHEDAQDAYMKHELYHVMEILPVKQVNKLDTHGKISIYNINDIMFKDSEKIT